MVTLYNAKLYLNCNWLIYIMQEKYCLNLYYVIKYFLIFKKFYTFLILYNNLLQTNAIGYF